MCPETEPGKQIDRQRPGGKLRSLVLFRTLAGLKRHRQSENIFFHRVVYAIRTLDCSFLSVVGQAAVGLRRKRKRDRESATCRISQRCRRLESRGRGDKDPLCRASEVSRFPALADKGIPFKRSRMKGQHYLYVNLCRYNGFKKPNHS